MRTTTPREIIQKARIRADLVYSSHTSDDEALIMLSDSYLELYALMSSCDETMYVVPTTLTLTDKEATLPNDMWKLVSVAYNCGGVVTKLDRISIQQRTGGDFYSLHAKACYYLQDNKIKVEGLPGSSVDILYVPDGQVLSSLDDIISLVSFEDSYLVASLWRDMAQREESDTRNAEAALAQATSRIKKTLTPRVRSDNVTVRDVYSEPRQPWLWRR